MAVSSDTQSQLRKLANVPAAFLTPSMISGLDWKTRLSLSVSRPKLISGLGVVVGYSTRYALRNLAQTVMLALGVVQTLGSKSRRVMAQLFWPGRVSILAPGNPAVGARLVSSMSDSP